MSAVPIDPTSKHQ